MTTLVKSISIPCRRGQHNSACRPDEWGCACFCHVLLSKVEAGAGDAITVPASGEDRVGSVFRSAGSGDAAKPPRRVAIQSRGDREGQNPALGLDRLPAVAPAGLPRSAVA